MKEQNIAEKISALIRSTRLERKKIAAKITAEMRAVSLARTPESRSEAGRKAWQTRIARAAKGAK
jgi:hypothetical protein